MSEIKSFLKKWGFKQQVLCLALLPPITVSLLLGAYFISIRLDELSNALHDRGTAVATRLASQGEYGLFAGDASALRRLAQREISNEVSSIAFYDKDGMEVASAGNLTSALELPKSINDVHVIANDDRSDVITFRVPVTLPEVIIDDDVDSSKLLSDNNLKSTIIGWLKIEIEKRATKLKSYQVFIQSCMIVFLGVCMSFLLAMRLDNKVSTPIMTLIRAVKKIKNGQLDTRINVSSSWELQILQSGINMMASSLERSHIEMQNNINQATSDLRKTLETIEVQNLELEKARNKAEEASKVKSEFIANMSHELRTPLNAITGFVGLMKKTNVNEQQFDYLKTIEASSTSLVAIINDILDFSKLEAGKVKMFYEKINIRECVEETLAMLAPSAHEKDIDLINFIYNDVPELMICDRLRLKQVITNLVNNAIKFTEKGSVVIRTMVEEMNDGGVKLCISITDTGIGLTEEQQKRIFHAFSQANPNITRKFGGTGLGLVICKKIIAQMHGEISLESKHGRGTTFWFTLPVKIEQELPLGKELYNFEAFVDKRILIYDRNKTHRIVIGNFLSTWGLEFIEVDSLEDVIPKIRTEDDIDVVILSVSNELIVNKLCHDTIDCVKSAKKKILLMANTTDHAIHGDLIKSGVDCAVAKPVSEKKFAKVLQNLLEDKTDISRRQQIKVLAVDDNFANMKLLTVLLRNMGASVVSAVNGKEAVELCMDNKFDAILMDINMPIMDGIEASELIRDPSSLNSSTPIIALSAHIQSEDREIFLDVGINDTMTKPVLENELKAILYKWIYSEVILEPGKEVEHVGRGQNIDSDSIDWSESLRLANQNEQLALDVLEMLYNSLQKDIAEINDCYKRKDFNSMYSVVHKFHGGCCYCGVPKLKEAAGILDKALRIKDLEHVDDFMHDFMEEVSSFKSEYECKYINNAYGITS